MTFLIWLMIWLSNGAFPKIHVSAYIRILMMVAFWAVYFVFCKMSSIKRKNIEFAAVFIGLQLFTVLLNGISASFDFNLMLVVLIGAIMASIIDMNDFFVAYQRGLVWVASISVVLYFVGLFTNLFSFIPSALLQDTASSSRYTLLGTFLITFNSNWITYRNSCLFTEPGQFQIFINLGIFIELFIKDKPSLKMLVLLVVTLLTCQSTNGFFVAILLVLGYVLNFDLEESVKAKYIRYGISVTLFAAFIVLWMNFDSLNIVQEVLGKVSDFFVNDYTMNDLGTGLERHRAFDLALEAYWQNPITGLGYKGMSDDIESIYSGSNLIILTFSPLNWFARFGTVYGILANFGYFRFFTSCVTKPIVKIAVCVAAIIMISGQAVNSDYLIWFMIMHGLNLNYKICKTKNLVNDIWR